MVFLLALRRWEPDTRWGLLARGRARLGARRHCSGATWSRTDSYQLGLGGRPSVCARGGVGRAGRPGRRGRPTPPRAASDRLTLLLPAVAAMCALGLLLYGCADRGPDRAVALALARGGAVMAGVVRWLIAVRREAQAAVLRDVADELARKAEQQATVADLGRQAVANGDEQGLMELAVKVVADSLSADRVARARARARRPRPSPAGRVWRRGCAAGPRGAGNRRARRRPAHGAEPPGHLRPDRAQGRAPGA